MFISRQQSRGLAARPWKFTRLIDLSMAVLLIALALVSLPAQGQTSDALDAHGDLLSRPGTKGVAMATITKEALKAKLDRNERLFLVAATDHKNFARCHLPGAIELQLKDARRKARRKLRDRQAQIVVYSQSTATDDCDRLARDLVAQGYTDVRVYTGGASEWTAAGYPADGSNPKSP
jgi:rhodanese-related sulfurtransferase